MIVILLLVRAAFATAALFLFARGWYQRRTDPSETIFDCSIATGLLGLVVLA